MVNLGANLRIVLIHVEAATSDLLHAGHDALLDLLLRLLLPLLALVDGPKSVHWLLGDFRSCQADLVQLEQARLVQHELHVDLRSGRFAVLEDFLVLDVALDFVDYELGDANFGAIILNLDSNELHVSVVVDVDVARTAQSRILIEDFERVVVLDRAKFVLVVELKLILLILSSLGLSLLGLVITLVFFSLLCNFDFDFSFNLDFSFS